MKKMIIGDNIVKSFGAGEKSTMFSMVCPLK